MGFDRISPEVSAGSEAQFPKVSVRLVARSLHASVEFASRLPKVSVDRPAMVFQASLELFCTGKGDQYGVQGCLCVVCPELILVLFRPKVSAGPEAKFPKVSALGTGEDVDVLRAFFGVFPQSVREAFPQSVRGL